jgi:nitroreductase
MDAIDAIKRRWSCREYLHKEVPFEEIAVLLDAAHSAPSAGNLQEWKFIVVFDRSKIEKIADLCPEQEWIRDAPVVVVFCAQSDKTEKYYEDLGKRFSGQSCAAAVQNLLIAATAQGLGSCWVGAYDEEKLIDVLSIKDSRPQAMVTLGYTDTPRDPPDKKLLESVVFFNKYGGKKKDVMAANKAYSDYFGKLLKTGKGWLSK